MPAVKSQLSTAGFSLITYASHLHDWLHAPAPLKLIQNAGTDVGAINCRKSLLLEAVGKNHHARVRTKDDVLTAGRPDERTCDELVVNQIVGVDRAAEALAVFRASASSEEVFDVEGRAAAVWQAVESAVIDFDYRDTQAMWDVDWNSDVTRLAVDALSGDTAGFGDKLIKEKAELRSVGRQSSRCGAGWTAVTAVAWISQADWICGELC